MSQTVTSVTRCTLNPAMQLLTSMCHWSGSRIWQGRLPADYLLWGSQRRLFERDIDLLPVWAAIERALWVAFLWSLKVGCSHSGNVQAVHALQEVLDLELQQIALSVLPLSWCCCPGASCKMEVGRVTATLVSQQQVDQIQSYELELGSLTVASAGQHLANTGDSLEGELRDVSCLLQGLLSLLGEGQRPEGYVRQQCR